jgi:hydrogenase nickel incorporation protein HypA/HybF
MHELSIATSIIEIAEQEAHRRGVRVSAVHLKLGPLSGVVKEALLSAYEIAVMGTTMEGSRLVVEDVPITVYCPKCSEQRTVDSMQWLCCPVCYTPVADIVQGSELQVTALEVEP